MQIVCRTHEPIEIFSTIKNIFANILQDVIYGEKSENILLRCKILPPPTSTSSSPSSDKKWCAHNLYSLPLPSTLLLDNLSKIIFFSHWSLYLSEMCSMLQISQKKMNSRLFMFSLFDIFQQYLRLDQNIRWAGEGEMLHCLDLIDSLGWLANLCFSKSVFLRLTLTFNSAQSLQNNDCEA